MPNHTPAIPDDPRIFNRPQADGTYRPLSEFFDREPVKEQTMTTIKIKGFEIEDVNIEAYMEEYDIETKAEAIRQIRQTAIDAIISQLARIGVVNNA